MNFKRRFLLTWICSILPFVGCAHTQLRFEHVEQAKTLTGIYEQQVLDNLAMFHQNPDSLPFFAIPAAGSATISDSAGIAAGPLNGPIRTILGPLSLSRGNQQSWTMQPVTDPERLRIMQGLYRSAIGIDQNTENISFESCAGKLIPSGCEKFGSYCGCTIKLCPESSGQFSSLVLNVMQAAVGELPKPKQNPTKQVEEFEYKGDKLFRKTKYTIQKDKDGIEKAINLFDAIPAFDAPNSIFQEQQLQLYRRSMFPQ